ncbi:MAG: MBL fold metallo-hydrolase [Verrucomicrobia bacterium]|nr:MBL fold metallo-hydrolase [Verrucomicrobiota bacterium]
MNPDTDIGASAWCVDLEGHRILLDAGMHPKLEGRDGLPLFKSIQPQDVDAIAITHCHHDHVGALPVACKYFPKAHVLMTDLSYFIAERVLHNSVNVMTRQREELGIREYPLYTHDEVDDITPHFQGFKYNREIAWAAFAKTRAGFTSPTLEFFDAGHTLGSAGAMLRGSKETIFYTGDVCFHDQTILAATAPSPPASPARRKSSGLSRTSSACSNARAACSSRRSRSGARRKSSPCSRCSCAKAS